MIFIAYIKDGLSLIQEQNLSHTMKTEIQFQTIIYIDYIMETQNTGKNIFLLYFYLVDLANFLTQEELLAGQEGR